MFIVNGVHQIDGIKGAQAYLITGARPFLVDTGLPGQAQAILDYLGRVGISPHDLTAIVITHYDVDHIGSAAALQKLTGCVVYASEVEIPYLQQKVPRPGIKRWLPLLTAPWYGRLQPLYDIVPLVDGDSLEGWECILTPGHTPGHLVLYRDGIVVAGDLLQGGTIRLAPSFLTWDSTLVRRSVRALLKRPWQWILPGHGSVTKASTHWLDNIQKVLSN